jgi:trans-aconitate 2-methyltransferase
MIAKARAEYPGQEWILADAGSYETDSRFDLIFSNAAIHWIPDHRALLRKFHGLLAEGGILAVQLPLFWDMPLGKIIDGVSRHPRWDSLTAQVANQFTIHDYSFYYDQFAALFRKVEIWETSYMDTLDSHLSMIDMIRSTGMKPYLEQLNSPAAREEFEQEVLTEIVKVYPVQQNGRVILPFKRLFFIGQR